MDPQSTHISTGSTTSHAYNHHTHLSVHENEHVNLRSGGSGSSCAAIRATARGALLGLLISLFQHHLEHNLWAWGRGYVSTLDSCLLSLQDWRLMPQHTHTHLRQVALDKDVWDGAIQGLELVECSSNVEQGGGFTVQVALLRRGQVRACEQGWLRNSTLVIHTP